MLAASLPSSSTSPPGAQLGAEHGGGPGVRGGACQRWSTTWLAAASCTSSRGGHLDAWSRARTQWKRQEVSVLLRTLDWRRGMYV
jgi:hypothetical protein